MTTTWSWQMICQRVGGLTCRTEQNSKQVDIGQSGVLHEITRDVNEVFNQAAVVIVQRSVNDPLACHKVNTHATLRLLELVREREFRVVPVLNAAICRHLGSLPLAKPESRGPHRTGFILTVDHYAGCTTSCTMWSHYGISVSSTRDNEQGIMP
jgi:GDP-D-mannose dehydratase